MTTWVRAGCGGRDRGCALHPALVQPSNRALWSSMSIPTIPTHQHAAIERTHTIWATLIPANAMQKQKQREGNHFHITGDEIWMDDDTHQSLCRRCDSSLDLRHIACMPPSVQSSIGPLPGRAHGTLPQSGRYLSTGRASLSSSISQVSPSTVMAVRKRQNSGDVIQAVGDIYDTNSLNSVLMWCARAKAGRDRSRAVSSWKRWSGDGKETSHSLAER